MTELFLRAIFADNLILSYFLGLCTYLAISKRLDTALGLAAAMIVVQTLTIPINFLIHHYLLLEGAWAWLGLPEVDLTFLKLIAFIGVIAAAVQMLEMTLDRDPEIRLLVARSDDAPASGGSWVDGVFLVRGGVLKPL